MIRSSAPSLPIFRLSDFSSLASRLAAISLSLLALAVAACSDGSGAGAPEPVVTELAFTVGEWLDATGGGTYTVTGDQAEIAVWFEGLVPGGVYTLWCAEIHTPPNFEIIDRPCGAPDGSENGFVADADGNGRLTVNLPELPESSETSIQVMAPAYHADGKNHGAVPGDFGTQTHVQLMHMLMPTEG